MKKLMLGLLLLVSTEAFAAMSDSKAMTEARKIWGNLAITEKVRQFGDSNWTYQIGYRDQTLCATSNPKCFRVVSSGISWDKAFMMIPTTTSVNLAWDKNNVESNLLGYNIYRAETSGGFTTPLNGVVLSPTSLCVSNPGSICYTDTTAKTGTTYFYVVRAVNTAMAQSANSNQISVAAGAP